jgi:hypothetical protein
MYEPKNKATWVRVGLLHQKKKKDHHNFDVKGSFLSITFVLIIEVADGTVSPPCCVLYFSETIVAL